MRAFCCVVAAVTICFSSTAAHAQVTSVEVAPNTFVGVPLKVTVKGGVCGAVMINFGDPNDPVPDNNETTFAIETLPFVKNHTWHNEGIFTIKATGQGNCTGSATAVVTVKKFTGTLSPRPKITGYFGLARPGGVAGIVGTALGSAGTVTATLKKWNGQTFVVPFERTDNPETTQILEWKSALIGIRWPDVSGVRAQDATIRVKVGNFTSNEWTVPFTPDTDFKMLELADVKVVSCSVDANSNVCNTVKDTNPCAPIPPISNELSPWPAGASIHGWHSNCPAVIGDDSGTDVYQVSLKNDWVLETFDLDKDRTGDDGDYIKDPTPAFPRGAATWKVSMKWLASADDEVTYNAMIGIIGPKGVPHK